jgi:hypothetical protein
MRSGLSHGSQEIADPVMRFIETLFGTGTVGQ